MQRFFLVGCPRSGTTIFQSLLAAHPEINTFPETKIFQYTLWDGFRHKLPERLQRFFYFKIMRPELLEPFRECQTTEETIIWFIGVLDGLTIENEKNIWVEKTPEHIFFIPEIQRYVPDARFIHITRNGLDTIASLWEATHMTENQPWGGQWTLNHCIQRWKDSIKITEKYAENKNHLIVKYERLISHKVEVLTECCNFVGIGYSPVMLTDYRFQALNLGGGMPWHQGIDRDIEAPAIPKYKKVFQQQEIEYILDKIQE